MEPNTEETRWAKAMAELKAWHNQNNKAVIVWLTPSGVRTTENKKVQRSQLIKDVACYLEGLGLYREGLLKARKW